MNKLIAIPVIAVLAVLVIVGGYVLLQRNNTLTDNLTEAESEIVALEGNITGLEGNVSTLQGKLTSSEAEVSSLSANLTESKAAVASLQTDLASANSSMKNLQGDVSTQRTLNSTLTTELKKVKDPRHFSTLTELVDWLAKDDTNTKYANETDWQKAFILQVRALRDGYLLPAGPYVVGGTLTLRNFAIIGDNIFVVQASDDNATRRSDVIKPMPSHPLPLD